MVKIINFMKRKQTKTMAFTIAILVAFFALAVINPAFADDEDCTIASRIAENRSDCFLCKIFGNVFSALSTLAQSAYDAVAPGAANLIFVGMLLWFAVQLLKFMGSLTAVDIMDFWKNALGQFLIAAIAIGALNGGLDVFDYFMGSIIEGGFDFAAAIATASSFSTDGFAYTPTGDPGNGAFSATMFQSMERVLQALQYQIAELRAIGSSLMCIALGPGKTGPTGFKFIPDFSMLIIGLFIWIFAIILLMVSPIYLLDSFVRLGFVACMLPLFVAAYVFKVTRDFTMKGFNMMLMSVMHFISVSITMAIIIQIIGAVFGGMNEVVGYINGNNIDELKKAFDFGGGKFLLLLAAFFFSLQLLKKTEEIANHFASTSLQGGAAGQVAGMGASLAKSAGGAAIGMAAGAAGGAVGAAGRGLFARADRNNAEKALNQSSFGKARTAMFNANRASSGEKPKVLANNGKAIDTNTASGQSKIAGMQAKAGNQGQTSRTQGWGGAENKGKNNDTNKNQNNITNQKGGIEIANKDGSKTTYNKNGSITEVDKDGNRTVYHTDGSMTKVNKDGSKTTKTYAQLEQEYSNEANKGHSNKKLNWVQKSGNYVGRKITDGIKEKVGYEGKFNVRDIEEQ